VAVTYLIQIFHHWELTTQFIRVTHLLLIIPLIQPSLAVNDYILNYPLEGVNYLSHPLVRVDI